MIFKLINLVHITQGYPFRGSIPEIASSSICAVQMRDLSERDGVVNWNSCVWTEITENVKNSFVQPGDILFAARGNRNYSVMVDDVASEIRAVASPHLFILRLKGSNVLPEYLVWFLNQEPCLKYFQKESTGSTTKSLRRSALENTSVAVPALEKQEVIIRMQRSLRKEQALAESLIENGRTIMRTVAIELLETQQPVTD